MNREELLQHRITAIIARHQKRDNELQQEGRRQARILCPIIAAVFALVAWDNFNRGATISGGIFAIAALLFVALLIAREILL